MVANGADIQIDRGSYTRIHNAILERLAHHDFTSREYACILYLLRMTYGFNRKECQLSNGDFAKATNIERPAIIKTLRGLVQRSVICKDEGDPYHAATWSFNKYFEQWDTPTSAKTITSSSVKTTTSQDDTSYQIDTSCSYQVDTTSSVETTTSYISAKEIKDSKDSNTPTGGDDAPVPLVEQFDTAVKAMGKTNNKVPHLITIYRMCFGKDNEPTGGELAGAAKQVGSASLLAKYMFDLVSHPPVGPVMPYIIAAHKAQQKRRAQTGGNREISEVTFAANGADIYG
jgi:phage replication O-like protein O